MTVPMRVCDWFVRVSMRSPMRRKSLVTCGCPEGEGREADHAPPHEGPKQEGLTAVRPCVSINGRQLIYRPTIRAHLLIKLKKLYKAGHVHLPSRHNLGIILADLRPNLFKYDLGYISAISPRSPGILGRLFDILSLVYLA